MILRLSLTEVWDDVFYLADQVAEVGGEVDSYDADTFRQTLLEAQAEDFAALDDPREGARLLVELGKALIPDVIKDALSDSSLGEAPTLVIRPSPSLSQVPWSLLELQPGISLMERARVRIGHPIGLSSKSVGRAGSTGGLMAIVDPYSTLDRVLDRSGARTWERSAQAIPGRSIVGAHVTRQDLHQLLGIETPSALLFYGHCVADPLGRLSQTGLLLSDTAADPVGRRPIPRILSARDLTIGTLERPEPGLPENTEGAELWPMPPRVAVIGCSSGVDARSVEPIGLAAVLAANGAEWLAATLWDVPTDRATSGATTRMALGAAHACVAEDPAMALDAWQQEQLDRWRSNPDDSDSPRTWGALTQFTSADYGFE